MKPPMSTRFRQIYVPLKDSNRYEPVESCEEKILCTSDHDAFRSRLLELCPHNLWAGANYTRGCPRPILITRQHDQELKNLHTSLAAAITDIVERWWTDSDAKFPERMPLQDVEEELLRWMDAQPSDIIPPFASRLGSWRPDFLVEEDADEKENMRITEINARFSFNGFMNLTYGSQAMNDIGVCGGGNGLVNAVDVEASMDGMLALFRPGFLVHFLKGEEPGMDIHMISDYATRHLGFTPRFITPEDLRLFPTNGTLTLHCLAPEESGSAITNEQGEHLEEIHQVALELHQRELLALSPEMLRQLSTRCFNDLRTVLLVHDKRMLGIIRQELGTLVKRKTLTPFQAEVLDKGIAETILPGSPELTHLMKRCQLNPDLGAEYITKPVRSGKGNGIVFGEDLTQTEWVARLESLCCSQPCRTPISSLSVVQRRIRPILYDVALGEDGSLSRYPLIGTYHAVAGKYVALGTWRSSLDRICAVSHGGAWICSVMEEQRNSVQPGTRLRLPSLAFALTGLIPVCLLLTYASGLGALGSMHSLLGL